MTTSLSQTLQPPQRASQKKIQFIDLYRQYERIQPEIDQAIAEVIRASAFSGGPFVERFETRFAQAHGAAYCAGVNSGTAALHLTLMALNIGPGDDVIVPANTFFATPEAVSLVGATPVFVDCDPVLYTIDPEKIEAAITEQTKAVIPVHLYGQPAQMDAICRITDKYGLSLIEDCSQSHLATFEGKLVGNFGIAGCFSFYPGKNLGAYGEAGAVITPSEALHKKIQALKSHGSHQKYLHDYIGHNLRMEGIQAAVLDVKLNYLPEWTEARRELAAEYRRHLQKLEPVLVLPVDHPGHVYHLFVIQTESRDALQAHLEAQGIATNIHYPVPCHQQNAYRNLEQVQPLAVSERLSKRILSLPLYPELTLEEIAWICQEIERFFA